MNQKCSTPSSTHLLIHSLTRSIKIAVTYTPKTANLKFFYLFPHKHLQILTILKLPEFSTKCTSSPKLWEGVFLLKCKPFRRLRTMNYKPQFLIHQFSNSLILSAFGETQSIKNNKLCETNPISEMPKINLTPCSTMTNNNKQRTTNYSKQSQSNPILSAVGGSILPILPKRYNLTALKRYIITAYRKCQSQT